MAYLEKAVEIKPDYMTSERFYSEVSYQNEQRRALEKKVRLLVRLLVDKGVIGAELAKSFEETTPKSNELIEWFLKEKMGDKNATG